MLDAAEKLLKANQELTDKCKKYIDEKTELEKENLRLKEQLRRAEENKRY